MLASNLIEKNRGAHKMKVLSAWSSFSDEFELAVVTESLGKKYLKCLKLRKGRGQFRSKRKFRICLSFKESQTSNHVTGYPSLNLIKQTLQLVGKNFWQICRSIIQSKYILCELNASNLCLFKSYN